MESAANAALLILALKPDKQVPGELTDWLEKWPHKRTKREGVLILLNGTEANAGPRESEQCYFRSIAHRAGMDFLTELPTNILEAMPESLDSYKERAGQMTSCLDEILRQQRASLRVRTAP